MKQTLTKTELIAAIQSKWDNKPTTPIEAALWVLNQYGITVCNEETDNYGQIVIHTNLKQTPSGKYRQMRDSDFD